jgi:lipopolysaccharide biosynthesis glycosyltransferase
LAYSLSKKLNPLQIALSTDAKGNPINATLIASILRRTKVPVHVRCWCRGFLSESFESGPLKVEFIPTDEVVTGKFPSQSGPAAYDRLLVIRDCPDWDRCMVMDYDQLVLCDLAPLFELDLGDHLLAAHMQGPGVDMAYAMRVRLKRPMPEGWEHVASHPYFLMPPVMNLKAMREAGTWENFLKAHAAFGADEQLSLTAATEGRTLPIDRKWNLFPRLHITDGEVPEGVIHWSGWPKPWHRGAKVWRPDIWESEKSSWEHLRMGIWEKPLSVELEPEDDRVVTALAQRGWRVKVYSSWDHDGQRPTRQPRFPDVDTFPASRDEFQDLLKQASGKIDQVRLGAWEDPAKWLDGAPTAPEYLVLKGGMDADEVERVLGLGYTEEARIMSGEWPAGGPLPRALDYHPCQAGTAVGPGEDLYLRMGENNNERTAVRLAVSANCKLPQLVDRKKVGLCVIATANERMNLRPFLRSLRRNFLPGHEVTVFLFTDGHVNQEPDLRVIPVKHNQRPGMTPNRYPTFVEHAAVFEGMEYLFHMDYIRMDDDDVYLPTYLQEMFQVSLEAGSDLTAFTTLLRHNQRTGSSHLIRESGIYGMTMCLSRKAVEYLLSRPNWEYEGFEDSWMDRSLEMAGYKRHVTKTERPMVLYVQHATNVSCADPVAALRGDVAQPADEIAIPPRVPPSRHPDCIIPIRDPASEGNIGLYETGEFVLQSTGEAGTWEVAADGCLILEFWGSGKKASYSCHE